MEERSENLGDSGRGESDLRADRNKLELGRNPRGEPLSVSEAVSRYKEAQARKFAEHAPPQQEDRAVTPIVEDIRVTDRRGSDDRINFKDQSGRQDDFQAADAPVAVPEARDIPLREERSATPVRESVRPKDRNGLAQRLNFREQDNGGHNAPQAADTASSADFGAAPDRQPGSLIQEQPVTEEVSPDTMTPASPANNGALSHEHAPRSVPERSGRLQTTRAPAVPIPPPKGKQKYSGITGYAPETAKQESQDSSAAPMAPGADTPASTPPDPAPQPEAKTVTVDTPAPETKADTSGEPAAEVDTKPDTPAAADAANTLPIPTGGGHNARPNERGVARGDGRDGKEKPSKLNFGDENDTPEGRKSKKLREKAEGRLEHSAGKVEKAQNRAGRSSKKLDKARTHLPKKRKLRKNNEFDAKKGKLKPRLRFENEVKSQRDHLKGAKITRPIKSGLTTATGFAHTKIYQAEHENVGVKAAHRAEMLAESGVRTAYRRHKTAPYRKVERLEGRVKKLDHEAARQKGLHKKHELKAKDAAKRAQKKRIKREYAKKAREAKRMGAKAKKTAVTTEKIAAKIVSAVKNHPVVMSIIGLILLIILIMFGLISSCSNMASGIGASIAAMAYTAEDGDINAVDLYYTELETDMRIQALNAEDDRPGYDEYRYDLGGVGHDPFMMMGFLTAVYQDFTFAGVQDILEELFNEQYQLTFTPSVETRYTYDDDGNAVPYDWHVLTVTLTSQPLFNVINPRMDDDQRQQYDLLMQSKGLRQYIAPPFAFNWLPTVSSYYGYRVHPIRGDKDRHLGIDIPVPTGTEILACHGGTVSFAGELGGYGNVVVLESDDGYITKYAHCDELFVSTGQPVSAGDVIAASGNTGSSTGPHLHFEFLKDGEYMNPIFFTSYGN